MPFPRPGDGPLISARRTLIAPSWTLALLLVPGLVLAQAAPQGPEAAQPSFWDPESRPPAQVEGEWFYLNGFLAFPTGGPWEVGPEIGLGLGDYVDLTDGDFRKFTHLGLRAGRPVGSVFGLDFSVQGGLAEFHPPGCNGLFECFTDDPQWFGGLAAGVHAGWPHFRIGIRFSTFRMSGENVAVWTPFFFMLRL